jgi:hypothetical protein
VSGLRWLFVLLLWAAMDLSGPLVLSPFEALEEPEEATHRATPGRRGRGSEARTRPATRRETREAREDRTRAPRPAVAAGFRRARETAIPPKLPPSASAHAADDH